MIFITYLGKMVLCSGILFGYYWLFLRNRRFHHYNRFYLLGSLALSIVLPLFKIPVFNEDTGALNQVVYQTARVVTLHSLPQQAIVPAGQTASLFTFSNFIWILYSAGILMLLAMLGRSLWYIRKISRQYPFELVEKLKFYQTHEPGTPFSFFRSIFWNDQLNFNSTQGQQIFRHELFHVQQKHSVDILLAELITIACWFNPFFHLIKKELKAIHEFLADQYAASDSNRYQYAELLVQQVMLDHRLSITHYFFQNQLKRRIAMITQLNQSRYGYWSRVMVLPVFVILFFSVALYAGENKKTTIINNNSLTATPNELHAQITDTIPAAEQQADKIRELKVIREKKIMLEKILQDEEVKTDTKAGNVLKKELLNLKLQEDALQKGNAREFEFSYDEKNTKALQLKIAYNEQLILKKMLQEKTVQEDQEITNSVKKKLLELQLQQQASEEKNANNNQQFNYDEKLLLEKEKNDALALRKELTLRRDSKKELEIIDLKLKTLNDVQQEETSEQHFDYVKEDTLSIALIRSFNRNFRYPIEMLNNGGEGSIWYSAFLDKTGKLQDYETYNEEPVAAQGKVQEIVIVGYSKQSGLILSPEKTQQLIKDEVLRLSEKKISLSGVGKIKPARYYYKATFRLEKDK